MDREKKQLLVFGYGLAAIFAFIATRLWVKHGWTVINILLVAGSVVLLYMTLFKLSDLKIFYEKWMKVVHVIGTVITTIILSVLFYLVFGIVGIVLRLLKKDLLDQRLDPNTTSYWIDRTSVFDKEHYKRQF